MLIDLLLWRSIHPVTVRPLRPRRQSASSSVRVREESCKIKPKAILFRPESTPGPRYTSNTRNSLKRPDALTVTFSCKTARGMLSSTTTARSRRTLGNLEILLNCNSLALNPDSISSSNRIWDVGHIRVISTNCGCNSPSQPIGTVSREDPRRAPWTQTRQRLRLEAHRRCVAGERQQIDDIAPSRRKNPTGSRALPHCSGQRVPAAKPHSVSISCKARAARRRTCCRSRTAARGFAAGADSRGTP